MSRRRPVVLDGGMATRLQATAGLPPFHSPTPWALERPDAVRAAHADFVAAGAEVLLTVTLRGLAAALPPGVDPVAVNRAAVRLAREAAGGRARVAGSIGPASTPQRRWAPGEDGGWADQARALGEADLLVLETFVSPAELLAAVRAVRPVFAGPVVASLCPDPAGGLYTGEAPGPWARALRDAGADVLGANCGSGPAGVVALVSALRDAAPGPTWAKPNAGPSGAPLPSPEAWARATLAAGADYVGGCCGVGPEGVRGLREAVG